MASIKYETDRGREGWKIRFRLDGRKQKTIWLGKIPEHIATVTKLHVEHLIAAKRNDLPPDPATTTWLATIDPALRDKLANCGLAESSAKVKARDITLGTWLQTYIDERKDVKESTRETYRKAQDSLTIYFGTSVNLRSITPADAKRWRIWMLTEGNRRTAGDDKSMSEETVRRRTGKVKQFFREAVARGYCESDPFAALPSTSRGNPDNQFFVPVEWIEKCIQKSPDRDWRTILALARFAGMRSPSELVSLEWDHVDLKNGRLEIHSDKTGKRVCPIFPELRPYLEEHTNRPTKYVINRYRSPDQNLRTTFEKIIKRAGLRQWPGCSTIFVLAARQN